MYLCLDCGALFEDSQKYTETHGLSSLLTRRGQAALYVVGPTLKLFAATCVANGLLGSM